MNIFVLDENPETCARYPCDKHKVLLGEMAKIILASQNVSAEKIIKAGF